MITRHLKSLGVEPDGEPPSIRDLLGSDEVILASPKQAAMVAEAAGRPANKYRGGGRLRRLKFLGLVVGLVLGVAGAPVSAQVASDMVPSASNAVLPDAWSSISLSPGQASVPRLNHWRAALAKVAAGTGRATVLVLGASQSAGGRAGSGGATDYNGAYPNAWPAVLAQMLNGFVPTTDNSLFSDQNLISKGVTYELYDTRAGAPPAGWAWGPSTQSLGGVALQYNNSGVNPFPFTPAQAFDTITFYYVQKPGQGSFAVNVDGGASLGTVATTGSNRNIGSTTFTVARAKHTINMVPNTDGQIVIIGIKTYDSTIPGIDIIRGARAGGTAANYILNTNPWDPLNTIATLAPDLIIVPLDKNDASLGTSIATMTANLQTIINAAQLSGDVIIGTESPSAISDIAYATQQQYARAVIALARANNIPFVSIFDRWVSYENLNNFFQNGTPTIASAGSGYTINQTNATFTVQGGTCTTPITLFGGTSAGGVVNTINSVANPGVCTVFPSSPATITGAGGSNATVNLTSGQILPYGDTQHPNKVGYKDWAAAIFDVVRPASVASALAGTAANDNAAAGKVGEFALASAPLTSATITVTIASPGVVTWTSHGRTCASAVYFTTTGALPTGITAATTYYITCGASLLTNTFQLSTTVANAIAGTSINTSGTQSGVHTGVGGARAATGTAIDVAALNLTPGDWDCRGASYFIPAGTTTVTSVAGWLNTTSATAPATGASTASGAINATLTTGAVQRLSLADERVSLALAAPVFLSAQAAFGTSTMDVGARLECRRPR